MELLLNRILLASDLSDTANEHSNDVSNALDLRLESTPQRMTMGPKSFFSQAAGFVSQLVMWDNCQGASQGQLSTLVGRPARGTKITRQSRSYGVRPLASWNGDQ